MVLEDACQADGGSYKGKRLGSIGDAGAFSFNEFKIITCGEGGALVTNNRRIYEGAMIHHDGGCVLWDHDLDLKAPFFAGVNYRIHEISSAILRVQLSRLDNILASLRREKEIMKRQLASEKGFIFSPVYDERGDCATNLALFFESEERARSLVNRLKESGIPAKVPLDSHRHVYASWDPILEKRGAHHPGCDAFKLSPRCPTYSNDMCPRTIEILGRTVLLETSATRVEDELRLFIANVKEALRSKKA